MGNPVVFLSDAEIERRLKQQAPRGQTNHIYNSLHHAYRLPDGTDIRGEIVDNPNFTQEDYRDLLPAMNPAADQDSLSGDQIYDAIPSSVQSDAFDSWMLELDKATTPIDQRIEQWGPTGSDANIIEPGTQVDLGSVVASAYPSDEDEYEEIMRQIMRNIS